jgi:hypothetical protein
VLTTDQKGAIAETAIAHQAAKLGIGVVRSCRRTREGMIHRPYTAEEIDLIIGYCAELERMFLIPPELFSSCRQMVQLRLHPTLNNQSLRIH